MSEAASQELLPPIPDDVNSLQSAVGSFPMGGTVRTGWLFLFPDRLVFAVGPGNMLWYPVPTPSGAKARLRYEKLARERGEGVIEIPIRDIVAVKRVRVLLKSDNAAIDTKSGKTCYTRDKLANWDAPIRSVLAANGIPVIDTGRGFRVRTPS